MLLFVVGVCGLGFDCYALFVCWLLVGVCCLLRVTVGCCAMLVVCCLLLMFWRLSSVVCCRCLMFADCCFLCVVCCELLLFDMFLLLFVVAV